MAISFKIDPRIKEALQKLADNENRSLSNYILNMFIKHLEENGIDYKTPPEKSKSG